MSTKMPAIPAGRVIFMLSRSQSLRQAQADPVHHNDSMMAAAFTGEMASEIIGIDRPAAMPNPPLELPAVSTAGIAAEYDQGLLIIRM